MAHPVARRRFLSGTAAFVAAPLVARAGLPPAVDVAIVGAGAAGLAAAARLIAAGRRVAVLEARDRIGGRAHTVTSALGVPFDRGAHWLHHGEANPFQADAARLGRPTWASAGGDIRLVRDGRTVENGPALLADAMAAVDRRAWLRSLAGADFPLGAVARTEMQSVAARLAAFAMATDPDRLSVRDWRGLAEGEDQVVEGGFGRLVADLWSSIPVATGHPVRRIDWTAADRIAVSGDFGTLDARRVIVTVPPPVLASGAIRFVPALPAARQEAIAALEGGRFVRVGLRLDAPLTEPPEYVLDLSATLRGETAALHLDRRQPLATVIFAGGHAEAISRGGEAALEAAARAALAGVLGSDVARRVRAASAADWSADPLARGAYTVAPVGAAGMRAAYGAPIDDRLFFAGDSAPGAHALTVTGARRSGEAAADTILAVPA